MIDKHNEGDNKIPLVIPASSFIRHNIASLVDMVHVALDTKNFSNVKVDIFDGLLQMLKGIIQSQSSPVFRKFMHEDGSLNENKLNNKIGTYTAIHKNTLVKSAEQAIKNDPILQELSKNTGSQSNIERREKGLIQEILMKYIRVIFTFGEKISPHQLEVLLQVDKNTLSKLNTSYTNKLKEIEEKSKNRYNDAPRVLENAYKNLFKDPENINRIKDIFHSKSSGKEKEGEISSLIHNLSQSQISSLMKKSLIYDFKMFSFILENEINFMSHGEFSQQIQILGQQIKKTDHLIEIFKEIGFSLEESTKESYQVFEEHDKQSLISLFASLPDPHAHIRTEKFGNIKKGEVFIKYLESLSSSQKQKEFWEKVQKMKKENMENSIPKPLSDVNLDEYDAQKIDIDHWITTPEFQKYEYIFTEIFANAESIDPQNIFTLNIDALDLKSIEHDAELFIGSIEKVKKPKENETLEEQNKRIDREKQHIQKRVNIFLNQMTELQNISDSGNTTIDSLMRNTPNHINTLIEWWRFVLKKRKVKKDGKPITIDEIKKLPHNSISYGILQKVIKRVEPLMEEYKGKLEIRTNRPANTSVRGIKKMAQEKHNILTKENVHIDHKDITRIDRKTGEKIKIAIKDITATYIPSNIHKIQTKNKNSGDLQNATIQKKHVKAIQEWISTGIQTCNTLLKRKRITDPQEREYFEMLKKEGIADENTLSEDDMNKVLLFIAKLKFIQAKSKDLEGMFVANDKNLTIIEELIQTSNTKSKKVEIRPPKQFYRAFEKFIKDHSANGNRITDLGGGLSIQDSIDDTIEVIVEQIEKMAQSKKVTHISIIDKTGEPLAFAKSPSGYRDIKLLVTLEDGAVAEFQFHFSSMYTMKKKGPKTYEIQPTIDEVRGEGMLFDLDEIKKIVHFARQTNRKLPHQSILNMLLSEGKITHIPNIFQYDVLNTQEPKKDENIKELSLDGLYNIIRSMKDKKITAKLDRLHRALADIGFGEMAADYVFKKTRK